MPYKDSEKRKACQAAYRDRNKERLREWDRQYYQDNREKRREQARLSHQKNSEKHRAKSAECNRAARLRRRMEIFELLGKECARCGFKDWRALQVDHINGGGTKEWLASKSPTTYYKRILEVGKGEYQILCANCNQIKRYENGETSKGYRLK